MGPSYSEYLFLSYAHQESAWVEAFTQAFSQRFLELETRRVKIWVDTENIRGGEVFNDKLELALKNAAAVLAIVSPLYHISSWCTRERYIFIEHCGGLDKLKSERIPRFFKIVKDHHRIRLLSELQELRFYGETKENESYLPTSDEFKIEINKAVRAIRELFRLINSRKTNVYLAAGTEMEGSRTKLSQYLSDHGYNLLPSVIEIGDHDPEDLEEEMKNCSYAIFLFGRESDKNLEQQIRRATTFGKPCLLWFRPDPSPEAKGEYQRVLEELRHRCGLIANSEIFDSTTVFDLWQAIEPRLKTQPPKTDMAMNEFGKRSVYLLFDASLPTETEAAMQVSHILSECDLHVVLCKRDDDHKNLIKACDGVLLLRTMAPASKDAWLQLSTDDVILSTGLKAKALVLADTSRVKLTATDVVLLEYSQPFSAQALGPFIQKLARARGANVGH